MKGLDTNVLVRYIVEDEPEQAALASELIEGQCDVDNPGFINLVVICELVWVLQKAYKSTREQIGAVLMNLLLTESFLIEYHDVAWQAYYDYNEGNADYADCLISRLNHALSCSTTYTFDTKASKLPHNTLLKKGSC
jgi:predicted nucleic-acid-binding protein